MASECFIALPLPLYHKFGIVSRGIRQFLINKYKKKLLTNLKCGDIIVVNSNEKDSSTVIRRREREYHGLKVFLRRGSVKTTFELR